MDESKDWTPPNITDFIENGIEIDGLQDHSTVNGPNLTSVLGVFGDRIEQEMKIRGGSLGHWHDRRSQYVKSVDAARRAGRQRKAAGAGEPTCGTLPV